MISQSKPKRAWWIHKSLLLASSNPSDHELAWLRARGFMEAVSLLEEHREPPRYDKTSATRAGWSICSMPISEGAAPSLEQLADFTNRVRVLRRSGRLLVFCQSGLGRSACVAAAYWIAKGFPENVAVARVTRARVKSDWLTAERRARLHAWEEKWRDLSASTRSTSS